MLGASLVVAAAACDDKEVDTPTKQAASQGDAEPDAKTPAKNAKDAKDKKTPSGPIVTFTSKGPQVANFRLEIGEPGTPMQHNAPRSVSHGFDVSYHNQEPKPLTFDVAAPANAKLTFAGVSAQADADGKASFSIPVATLVAAVEPAESETRPGEYIWKTTFPITVDDDGAQTTLELKVDPKRYLDARWSSVKRDKPGVLPGDDPAGPRKGAVFYRATLYTPIGDTVKSAYDVDLFVFEDFDQKQKARAMKCGPYGEQKKFFTMEFRDSVLEARDIRTGEVAGTKKIKAKSAKCPDKIWADTTKQTKDANTLLIYNEPSVRAWIEGLLK
ncbi:MAG: hypothetical protein H6713_37830 [Myxococcales bacterium]|nr:hypothetical protein [Myxococcales bacterium]